MSTVKNALITLITLLIAGGLAWAGSVTSTQVNGLPLFALLVVIAFVIQWIAFIPAHIQQSERYFDLVGSGTYILVAISALVFTETKSPVAILLTLMIVIWAARLGSFLFARIHKNGKDGRFDQIKPNFMRHLNLWTIQGLWVSITAGAALAVTSSTSEASISTVTIIGALVWLLGFSTEVIADKQKGEFRAIAENKAKFINTGLWAWSRHPNYLGEITLWIGIAIIAAPLLQGWQLLTLISPVFVFVLLTRISGVNMLEKRGDDTWGGQAEYEAYKARTGVLLPKFTRKPNSEHSSAHS